jgi:hypothetical protein
MYIFKPIYLWWELLFQHGVIMVMTTKGTTEEDNKLTFPIYAFGLCSCGFFAHPL